MVGNLNWQFGGLLLQLNLPIFYAAFSIAIPYWTAKFKSANWQFGPQQLNLIPTNTSSYEIYSTKIDRKLTKSVHTWVSLGMMVPLWGTTLSKPNSMLFNFHWYLIKKKLIFNSNGYKNLLLMCVHTLGVVLRYWWFCSLQKMLSQHKLVWKTTAPSFVRMNKSRLACVYTRSRWILIILHLIIQ